MARPKIAIVHPYLARGGSEAITVWSVEALKRDHDVCLITASKVDLPALNAYYGTTLATGDLTTLRVPIPFFARNRFAALRGSLVGRFSRRIGRKFDVLLASYNPVDFGVRAMQYISDLSFSEELRHRFDPAPPDWRWWYADSPLRWGYRALVRAISGSGRELPPGNITLVNSSWVGQVLKRCYGIDSVTLYPPVSKPPSRVPFDEREEGFVWVGRLSPEKRVTLAIEILERLRQRGWKVHLHIIGAIEERSPYVRGVMQLCQRHQKWVSLEPDVRGARKFDLIAAHRFAIHTRQAEPFGIAVAEMAKAGCIVFVPDGGGQVEIVDHPLLVYQDKDDAVTKIEQVLGNPDLRLTLRRHLEVASEKFSSDQFMEGIRANIAKFLSEAPRRNG